MISKQLFTSVILSGLFLTQTAWAQTPVANLADAKSLMLSVGEELGSENDDNAVFVTDSVKAKSLLIELLKGQKKTQDIAAVRGADYVSVVVQNNDEARIYYYVINKGQTQALEVGHSLAVVDLSYSVCSSDGERSQLPGKFAKRQNLLLGMDANSSVIGTVWFDDVECEEN